MARPRNKKDLGKGVIQPSTTSNDKRLRESSKAAKTPQGDWNQAIPAVVTNRMARRTAIAAGVPTLIGMVMFIISYLLVSRSILNIPPGITLLATGGCFLLGLLGLSYGVISSSWEDTPGTLLGTEQMGLNIRRLRASFRPASAADPKK